MLTQLGINTGFGGSADTRTKAIHELKKDLLRGLQYGSFMESPSYKYSIKLEGEQKESHIDPLPLQHQVTSSMPESWVRASMLVRLNSLAHGASGVLNSTVSALMKLLQKNIVPRVPLRGSISASGDLNPLAYIAGVLEGKPALSAWIDGLNGQRRLERADVALSEHAIQPIDLGPKEGLALVNGTSVSAAVAALAMHEALCLAGLSQILTAMSVEALNGTDESFDPFLADVRPHWGQKESAQNIYSFLKDSSHVFRGHGSVESSLRQDRYSIRTASQWIGPALEDLLLAHHQILTELNSATDNPLIDTVSAPPRIVHGGNFQAKSIASATEKIRQVAQTLGRLLFTQCTELINPATSRGLPPNLVAGDPSESFIFKGTDILIASLLSELGFLANPISPHVQSAEMGNQALNSLALISARYSIDVLDILAQLAAAHLVAVCQALDLRALHRSFLQALEPDFHGAFTQDLHAHLSDPNALESMKKFCWNSFTTRLDSTTTLDSSIRISSAVSQLQPLLLTSINCSIDSVKALMEWTQRMGTHGQELYRVIWKEYVRSPNAGPLIGRAGRRMYDYTRKELEVPFVVPETLRTPKRGKAAEVYEDGVRGITMGDLNGRVRQAMATGDLYQIVVECLKEVKAN